MNVLRYCVGLSVIILSGCANLAPDYQKLNMPVSGKWSQEINNIQDTSVLSHEMGWHDFFTDHRLRSVIDLALDNNRDLRIAVLNIQKVHAKYQIQRSNRYPVIEGLIGGSAKGLSRNQSSTGSQSTVHEYDIGVGFSTFEIDFWGRVNNLEIAALESYLSTEQAYRSVQIALVGEIANAYLTLAANEERLFLTKQTLEAQSASYKLIKHKYEFGALSELALRQSSIQVETARVDLSSLKMQVEADKNTLIFLVGKPIPQDLLPPVGQNVSLKQISISTNMSSEVLLKRPDVMAAEHNLRGMNANIGAARAAFYPRITLTSNAGFASDSLSNLFKSGSSVWGFIPNIVIPIFDYQRNNSNLEIAKVDQKIALANYEKTIQIAFREVADTLSQKLLIHEQITAQLALTKSAGSAYQLSTLRFEQGVDSYLSVLDSQRLLYGAQQVLVQLKLDKATSQVNLYKALGGGAS